ncbi:quinone-dependent dihydroorotate dehydrogenase [Schaalia sp. ZJ405]|uniref:quinone-dependent dihydroorotate dehydrogenase n=1 Tax=Schaalia sp. ZJ405 TaxID=2709403 RepID=UPI0013EC0B52|nr:quinone-dependent dihydroorotate dehydrogenase [Schaalia sp. ZJ405]QPK80560.1 quinone-dependent dihydroorotate dehydrogenase [Schaalia sp. ZJ405]
MIRRTYTWLFDRFITHTDPEMAHHIGISAIAWAGRVAPLRGLMRATIGYLPERARNGASSRPAPVKIGTREIRGRLGLAAGMDKDAKAVLGLDAMGFAFVEVGTITPRPQPGNDQPRLWRLHESHGLRNRMGFNNEGADAAAEKLKELRTTPAGRRAVVGANIGKNKVTPEDEAHRDYEYCARTLARWVDFIVVNVSSPNTPGLRDLQSVDHLRPILQAARDGARIGAPDREIPLFVKIAPDLDKDDIIAVTRLASEMGLAGIVATNTTISHDLGDGGVSGAPLYDRALEVVRLIGDHIDDNQILIATGGIFSEADAVRMLNAGADLVEAFSAFIYEGPSWPGEMNRALTSF